jgi:hypothetical protein
MSTVPLPPVKGPDSCFPSIERAYGRPVAEWLALLRASPLTRHGELVGWLKTAHASGTGARTGSWRMCAGRTGEVTGGGVTWGRGRGLPGGGLSGRGGCPLPRVPRRPPPGSLPAPP